MWHILLVGADASLLHSRCLVLQTITATISSSTAADAVAILEQRAIDLLIVCHTLSNKDAQSLCETSRRCTPAVKSLLIVTADQARAEACVADLLFLVDDGPERLVRAAESLLPDPGSQRTGRNPLSFHGARQASSHKAPAAASPVLNGPNAEGLS